MTGEAPRTCGGCTACCFTHSVGSVKPFLFTTCPHDRPGEGCAIYGEHPAGCKKYRCWWLIASKAPESMRPDRLGVVLDVQELKGYRLPLVIAWERVPGRFAADDVRRLLHSIGTSGNDVVLCISAGATGAPGNAKFELITPASMSEEERASYGMAILKVFGIDPAAEGQEKALTTSS